MPNMNISRLKNDWLWLKENFSGSASLDKSIKIWDANSGARLKYTLDAANGWHQDAAVALTAYEDEVEGTKTWLYSRAAQLIIKLIYWTILTSITYDWKVIYKVILRLLLAFFGLLSVNLLRTRRLSFGITIRACLCILLIRQMGVIAKLFGLWFILAVVWWWVALDTSMVWLVSSKFGTCQVWAWDTALIKQMVALQKEYTRLK